MGKRKDIAYKNVEYFFFQKDNKYQQQIIETKRSALQSKHCKDFEWYLKSVAHNIYTPSGGTTTYGMLKVKSGGCSHVSGEDNRIELINCGKLDVENIFELTDNGQLKNKGKCMTVEDDAYVLAKDCIQGENRQLWDYDTQHRLKNVYSGYCAMHVTDPDKTVRERRQIFMVQDCSLDKEGVFIDWEFLVPDS